MPLPIGHALAGIAQQRLRPGLFFRRGWQDVLFLAFLANLPDADFLPGILLGRPNLFHHGIFHSLGAAAAVALVGGWLFRLSHRRLGTTAAAIFLAYSSHLLLDCLALDFVPPYGLPLLWPFSGRYFIAAKPFFLNITRSAQSHDFLSSLFSRHNLAAALREIAILGGAALAFDLLRRWRDKRRLRAR